MTPDRRSQPDPRCSAMLWADDIRLADTGKYVIDGEFEVIHLHAFPAIGPFALFLAITGLSGDGAYVVEFLAPDGTKLWEKSTRFTGTNPRQVSTNGIKAGWPIPVPGEYRAVVRVGDRVIGERTLPIGPSKWIEDEGY